MRIFCVLLKFVKFSGKTIGLFRAKKVKILIFFVRFRYFESSKWFSSVSQYQLSTYTSFSFWAINPKIILHLTYEGFYTSIISHDEFPEHQQLIAQEINKNGIKRHTGT
ncbi:MAG TPA: hypothetical protein DCS93_40730 [Microscillaceae bacterium]|nr:hypothetical protein [Microscillaceae bacterium]